MADKVGVEVAVNVDDQDHVGSISLQPQADGHLVVVKDTSVLIAFTYQMPVTLCNVAFEGPAGFSWPHNKPSKKLMWHHMAGLAVCHPKDVWQPHLAQRLALRRALGVGLYMCPPIDRVLGLGTAQLVLAHFRRLQRGMGITLNLQHLVKDEDKDAGALEI